jgi:hypothetical protein
VGPVSKVRAPLGRLSAARCRAAYVAYDRGEADGLGEYDGLGVGVGVGVAVGVGVGVGVAVGVGGGGGGGGVVPAQPWLITNCAFVFAPS